jgi:hypothetical protein
MPINLGYVQEYTHWRFWKIERINWRNTDTLQLIGDRLPGFTRAVAL